MSRKFESEMTLHTGLKAEEGVPSDFVEKGEARRDVQGAVPWA